MGRLPIYVEAEKEDNMRNITLTVDELNSSQLVYSSELDKFVQLTFILPTEIASQLTAEQGKIAASQTRVNAFMALNLQRESSLNTNPIIP